MRALIANVFLDSKVEQAEMLKQKAEVLERNFREKDGTFMGLVYERMLRRLRSHSLAAERTITNKPQQMLWRKLNAK